MEYSDMIYGITMEEAGYLEDSFRASVAGFDVLFSKPYA